MKKTWSLMKMAMNKYTDKALIALKLGIIWYAISFKL